MGLSLLFRPLPRRAARPKLDVLSEFDGWELHWRGPDALGIPEETLLYVILKLAQEHLHALTSAPKTNTGVALRSGLNPTGLLAHETAVSLTTTYSALAKGCNYDTSGPSLRLVRSMLKRMVEVTLWVRRNGMEGSTRLIFFMVSDDNTVRIALNHRLAAAVLGHQYVQVCLAERLSLSSPTAQALHARLSAQLRAGAEWSFSLKSLEAKVWGEPADGSTQRSRRERLLGAIEQIRALAGWSVTRNDEKFVISRKSYATRSGGRRSE